MKCRTLMRSVVIATLISTVMIAPARAREFVFPIATDMLARLDAAAAGNVPYVAPPAVGPLSTPINTPFALEQLDVERPTLAWTKLATDLFVKHKTSPNRAARTLAILHAAMHDASVYTRKYCANERCIARAQSLAVSAAAARVFRYVFVPEGNSFDRIVDRLAFGDQRVTQNVDAKAISKWLSVGQVVGDIAVAYAESDGAAKGWNGSNLEYYGEGRTYGPGSWEPTAPYFYYPPEEPFAPGWRTWALDRASEFRPARPEFATESYVDALREVLAFSPDKLTDDQKRVALFWADGRGTVTPPGHWNLIALDLVQQSKLSSDEVVQLFALLNLALADAFVAAWDAKYAYWTMRPVTAAKKLLGVNFTPLILTPAFPSYVSGHATFSGAAATVLAKYFPDRATTVQAMAEEAALSRLYGGIHFRFDNDDGLVLGRRVAVRVIERYCR
ncbi:MAG: vanadium-dependent haloperoxidase [Burkholderiales bacterium]|nr:vanadium-dependent haloperoxidase [Burkholderiales bacterium]